MGKQEYYSVGKGSGMISRRGILRGFEPPIVAHEATDLLAAWAAEDPSARDRLIPLLYNELRRLAGAYMRRERDSHTLEPTALVHEVFLRLGGLDRMQFRDRSHFMAMAATLMRRILVEHARDRKRQKRGGALSITSLGDLDVPAPSAPIDLLALDEALTELAAMDPVQGRVVELRFFVGMTVEETAHALDISPATVKREWALARAWLYRQLSAT